MKIALIPAEVVAPDKELVRFPFREVEWRDGQIFLVVLFGAGLAGHLIRSGSYFDLQIEVDDGLVELALGPLAHLAVITNRYYVVWTLSAHYLQTIDWVIVPASLLILKATLRDRGGFGSHIPLENVTGSSGTHDDIGHERVEDCLSDFVLWG